MKTPVYVIVTPARNEAKDIQKTIDSLVAQTIRPARWVVVDDGSTDGMTEIVQRSVLQHPWITLVRRTDRGARKAGAGVIEAFYEGYALVKDEAWDFVVKLDGDLSFDPDYFARCFEAFAADPSLGIAGGTICIQVNGTLEPESKVDKPFHVRGATKIYRRKCWEQIGGLIRESGWDTLDEIKSNMLEWKTRTIGGPGLNVWHHRPTGKADGAWKNWFKNGRANYIVGYHPVFMFVKCLRRLLEKPYLLAGTALWCGFISGYLQGVAQIDDRPLIRYLRRQQMRRMMFQSSLWAEK